MSKLVLSGDTSGSVTLDAPAVSGTTTLTLPTTSGTVIASNSSGDVGIGTTSPKNNSGWTTLTINNASQGGVLELTNNNTTIGQIYNDASNVYINSASTKNIQLVATGAAYVSTTTNGVERMRIDSSGNVLVGTTTVLSAGKIGVLFAGNTHNGIEFKNTFASNSGSFQVFLNSAGAVAGSINHTGATTVSYATSSDYRLKENISPMVGALDKVAQLKPVTYTWKQDGSNSQGFIAHELQDIIPDCVVGDKDEVDDKGNPKYQQIDTSFLVATLTAAIQEQQAIINDLKARIETLEAK